MRPDLHRERVMAGSVKDRVYGHFSSLIDTRTLVPKAWKTGKFKINPISPYALSSFMYTMAGFMILTVFNPSKNYIGNQSVDGALLSFQGFLSYKADVLCFGRDSIWHAVDRTVASLLTLYFAASKIAFLGPTDLIFYILTLGFGMIAFSRSRLARSEEYADFQGYLFWHGVWHTTFPLGFVAWCSYRHSL
ncbi:hypothetical protein AAMO2058_000251700 [Amorphochlora amoebiformis]